MKISRRRRLVFAALLAIALLATLNFLAGRLLQHPAVNAYEGIYEGHPTRIHALRPGAKKTVPIGLFGAYAEQWKASGATYDIQINEQGYRDRPFGPKTGPRVLALGDSSTFGWDVAAAETWPKVLENLLRERGRAVEVLNLGVPGYSTHQARLLLEEIWPLEPDLLILAYGRNDELDTAFSPTAEGRGRTDAEMMPGDRVAPAPPPTLRRRLRETGLYRAILGLFHSESPDPAASAGAERSLRRVPLPEYRENLRALVAAARARGVPVILVSIGCFTEEYRRALVEVAAAEGVPGLDTYPLLFSKIPEIKTAERFAPCRDRLLGWLGMETLAGCPDGWLWFSTDFGHPNACGHRVIAEALLPLVE